MTEKRKPIEREWPLKIHIPPESLGTRRPLREFREFQPTDPAPQNDLPDDINPAAEEAAPYPTPSTSSESTMFDRTSLHAPDFSRHSRRCNVCSHPDRDIIEAEFIRWANADQLSRQFNIGDRSSIYRHAHATGLFRRRKRELCRVLEYILESVDFVNFETADVVTRAARVYSHLDDDGNWLEPPKTVTILHGQAPAAAPANRPEPPAAELAPDPEFLIATTTETEIPVTP